MNVEIECRTKEEASVTSHSVFPAFGYDIRTTMTWLSGKYTKTIDETRYEEQSFICPLCGKKLLLVSYPPVLPSRADRGVFREHPIFAGSLLTTVLAVILMFVFKSTSFVGYFVALFAIALLVLLWTVRDVNDVPIVYERQLCCNAYETEGWDVDERHVVRDTQDARDFLEKIQRRPIEGHVLSCSRYNRVKHCDGEKMPSLLNVLQESYLFSIDPKFETDLRKNNVSEDLRKTFEANTCPLSNNVEISTIECPIALFEKNFLHTLEMNGQLNWDMRLAIKDNCGWKIRDGKKGYIIRYRGSYDWLKVYSESKIVEFFNGIEPTWILTFQNAISFQPRDSLSSVKGTAIFTERGVLFIGPQSDWIDAELLVPQEPQCIFFIPRENIQNIKYTWANGMVVESRNKEQTRDFLLWGGHRTYKACEAEMQEYVKSTRQKG